METRLIWGMGKKCFFTFKAAVCDNNNKYDSELWDEEIPDWWRRKIRINLQMKKSDAELPSFLFNIDW